MKSIFKFTAIAFLLSFLLSSCDILTSDEEISCDTFTNSFDNASIDVKMAKVNYQNESTEENCKAYKESLQAYLLAIAALTTVDYCITEKSANGDNFADIIIEETLMTEQELERLDNECPD